MSCSAEIKEIKNGENGEILVGVDYVYNDVADGDRNWLTIFPEQLKLLTLQEKIDYIKERLNQRCEEIILREYVKVNNYPLIELRKEIQVTEFDKIKDSLLNVTITKDTATLILDSDGDGIDDKQIEIIHC